MKNRKHIHRKLGIRVGPTDGKETIGEARRVFFRNIDKAFFREGLSWPGSPTPGRSLVAYPVEQEFLCHATVAEVFTSTGIELEKIIVAESEVVDFCRKYPEELRDFNSGMFFLIKKGVSVSDDGSNVYVVGVYASDDDGLEVVLYPFWSEAGWSKGVDVVTNVDVPLKVYIVVPH